MLARRIQFCWQHLSIIISRQDETCLVLFIWPHWVLTLVLLMSQHFFPAFLILHCWPQDPHWARLCCSLVFSSTLVIRSADGPVHASSVLRVTGHWALVSGDTERRGLTWLFVVVVAWSSLAPVVSKVFALPLAIGWGVNFLLHFDIILGKKPKDDFPSIYYYF